MQTQSAEELIANHCFISKWLKLKELLKAFQQ